MHGRENVRISEALDVTYLKVSIQERDTWHRNRSDNGEPKALEALERELILEYSSALFKLCLIPLLKSLGTGLNVIESTFIIELLNSIYSAMLLCRD